AGPPTGRWRGRPAGTSRTVRPRAWPDRPRCGGAGRSAPGGSLVCGRATAVPPDPTPQGEAARRWCATRGGTRDGAGCRGVPTTRPVSGSLGVGRLGSRRPVPVPVEDRRCDGDRLDPTDPARVPRVHAGELEQRETEGVLDQVCLDLTEQTLLLGGVRLDHQVVVQRVHLGVAVAEEVVRGPGAVVRLRLRDGGR